MHRAGTEGHTSHGVDSHASSILQAPLKPLGWLAEGLQKEVMQHWREACCHLQPEQQCTKLLSLSSHSSFNQSTWVCKVDFICDRHAALTVMSICIAHRSLF